MYIFILNIFHNYYYISYNMVLYYPVYECNHYLLFERLDLLLYFHFL